MNRSLGREKGKGIRIILVDIKAVNVFNQIAVFAAFHDLNLGDNHFQVLLIDGHFFDGNLAVDGYFGCKEYLTCCPVVLVSPGNTKQQQKQEFTLHTADWPGNWRDMGKEKN
jgi:hypothetical protein